MTFWTLIQRSLRFHARAHLGVILGAAIGSAALSGALLVGDSVRQSLRSMAWARLGPIHFAIATGERPFLTNFCGRMSGDQGPTLVPLEGAANGHIYPKSGRPLTVALMLPGMVSRQDGAARANQVNILGVDAGSWQAMAARSRSSSNLWTEDWTAGKAALVNEALAQRLHARPGDEVVVRVQKPNALGLDAAISSRNETAVALRLKVGALLPAELLGGFSLAAGQVPPANLFLPLDVLQAKVALSGRANLVLFGPVLQPAKVRWGPFPGDRFTGRPSDSPGQVDDERALPWLSRRVHRSWLLEDVGLSVRALEPPQMITGADSAQGTIEVTSSRIFLEEAVVEAALRPRTALLTNHISFPADTTNDVALCQFAAHGVGILTYLVNLIRAGEAATPYSMVTATDGPLVPPEMRDDEILANEWLADDLKVKPGDSVELSYFVVDSGSRLLERTNAFRVRAIVPLKGIYADRTLMPEFAGLAKAESTHDWDAGFPLVHKIREKDEAYWRQYRGTPKAFVTLAAGRKMWANRFGALTAMRYQVPAQPIAKTHSRALSPSDGESDQGREAANSRTRAYREAAYRNLLANLEPSQLGLRIEPVRQQALQAAAQSQDFGQLFLGFSFFLVAAALLLTGLLFQLGLEQRGLEVGTLLALGFRTRQVRLLLLAEGAALSLAGGILGWVAGIGYAKAMLWGLTTLWRDAVGTSALRFHAEAATSVIGVLAGTTTAVIALWVTLRKQVNRPASQLLAPGARSQEPGTRTRIVWVGAASGLGAVALLVWGATSRESSAGAFFGAGALLLIAGLSSVALLLGALGRKVSSAGLTLGRLGLRSCGRRAKRSLSTVALLACGCFVIVAIGVFRLEATRGAARRSSGTGGFALLGQSTLPVTQDLNSKSGREFFGMRAEDLTGVQVVACRVREGDEASCLNLNRAQKPRLIGVDPERLRDRFTFTRVARGVDRTQGWQALRADRDRGGLLRDEIPAVGDANSIQWALGKKIGDTIDYTDEHGRVFKLRLVGAVANSILQGSLLINEAEFVKRFPNESGYRIFLIDAPADAVGRVSATLSRALQDLGLELTPAAQRLNSFNAVQNTYLSTFQILGGLGLLLGSAGLGVVVLRNVLERRGELGLLVAVGFRPRRLQTLLLLEHGVLLALGLGVGVFAASVAVLPTLLTPGTPLPLGSLGLTLGAVFLNGGLWTWLATRYALRGVLLEALRNE